jgi:predicted metal-dependent HD superfamily phosphohydrolase
MTLLTIEDCVALEGRWREPQRVYHGMRHLEECLARFAEVRALAQDADSVEAALWFHDAIYDARRDDNEARSAALARAMLEQRGVDSARIARVESIILATRHAFPSANADFSGEARRDSDALFGLATDLSDGVVSQSLG